MLATSGIDQSTPLVSGRTRFDIINWMGMRGLGRLPLKGSSSSNINRTDEVNAPLNYASVSKNHSGKTSTNSFLLTLLDVAIFSNRGIIVHLGSTSSMML